MNNFSVRSLISAPVIENKRLLAQDAAEYVISVINFLNSFTNKHLSIYPQEHIENGLTLEMCRILRDKWTTDHSIIDGFLLAHANDLDKTTQFMVQSFKYAIKDKFICVKYYPEYAVFLSVTHKQFFAVRSMIQDFAEFVPKVPPYCIETLLLPFFDTIIWDGIVGMVNVDFSFASTKEMLNACKEARHKNEIIHRLFKIEEKKHE
jgi:hypothetical protein